MIIRPTQITSQHLLALTTEENGPHVSVYLPTMVSGAETRQNPIRFRNLLNNVREQLEQCEETTSAEAEALLGVAIELARQSENSEFWKHQDHGLALFAREGFCETYSLPQSWSELAVVGRNFQIVPLLSTIQQDGQYFALVVTLKEAHLFRVSCQSIEQIDGDDRALTLPQPSLSPKDTNGRNVRSFRQSSGGEATAMYHGHEESDLAEKVLRYLREVNEAVTGYLNDYDTPLVFAGTDSLFPLYQQINTHRTLLESSVTGNPQSFTREELRDATWKLLRPLFRERREAAVGAFQKARTAQRTSEELLEILQDANNGLINTLLIDREIQCWGTLDESTPQLTLHEEHESGDTDLINLAAIKTLAYGGAVVSLPSDEMPDPGKVVAVLRQSKARLSDVVTS